MASVVRPTLLYIWRRSPNVKKCWTHYTRLSLLVLGLTLIGSLFIERPWCKYLCPYGALLGIFNLFRIIKLKRNEKTCINCKACDRVCPMNVDISTSKVISNHQCIGCLYVPMKWPVRLIIP